MLLAAVMLSCSSTQLYAVYIISISAAIVPIASILLHQQSKYGISFNLANIVRVLGIFNALSPLLRSCISDIGTLGWSAIWSFGLIAMWPFPTIYGYAFISIGRKLNQQQDNNWLVHLYTVFQTLMLIFSIIYCVRLLITPLNVDDSYIWILSVILPGFLGMISAYLYFLVPFRRHIKQANMLDTDPKVWKSVLWIGIALVLPCVISRLLYVASAIQTVDNCNALIMQAIASLFTLSVEFMLYMDVPYFFLKFLYNLAPPLFLGKSFESLNSRVSTLRNSTYFNSGIKSIKYSQLNDSPIAMKVGDQ